MAGAETKRGDTTPTLLPRCTIGRMSRTAMCATDESGESMFAINLAAILFELSAKSDMSSVSRDEMLERFESLRGNRRIPHGRERRSQQLTASEIAAALLGLAPPNPKWAGHSSIVLCNLRTVGGASASFYGASTLQEAIERILTDASARKTVVRLSVSGAESGTNSHGAATLAHEVDGTRHYVFYMPKEAVSQLQSGSEQRYDGDLRNAPLSRELTFNRWFFDRLAKAMELAKLHSVAPKGDGSEYETEEAREARYRKLGARPGSRFLNIGVDNQVTWPKEETVVRFDRYTFVLMPKTRDNVQSIHVDLTENKLTDRDAVTVINRFLSIMTWCDDQFAIAQDGWSGNPVPVAVPRRNLAFTTAHDWIFDRKIPPDENARRALAVYREGRNAQQNFMVSYAVLNFYKIIEIGQQNPRGDVKNWFRDNFEVLRQQASYREEFERFAKICGDELPHEYIYDACRIAVAHAGKDSQSDPDDAHELMRLHTAADVLRLFARHFIESEFHISDVMYSGD